MELEISPECDVAQNKRKFYRMIPGMVISESLMETILNTFASTYKLDTNQTNQALIYFFKNGQLSFKNCPESIFVTPKFEFKADGECFDVFLILDLSQFKTIPIQNEGNDYLADKEMLFSVNSDLLQSIKNSLANNIQKKGYQHI